MSRELSEEGLNQLEGCAQETALCRGVGVQGVGWTCEERGSSRRSGVQRATYVGSVLKRSVRMFCDKWDMEAKQGDQASAALQQQTQWLRPEKEK